MDVWKIAKHTQCGIMISIDRGFNQALQFNDTANGFARFQRFEMSPKFYTDASIITPWSMVVRLSHVGKSSYLLENQTVCQKTGELLIKNLILGVRVDMKTRRPAPFPEEGLSSFRNYASSVPPPRFDFPDTQADPERCFVASTTALPSDTDVNQHVNHAISLKYCVDCASFAATKGGVLQNFTNDVAYYNLKTFSIEYLGEIQEEDVVDVTCWEDEIKPGVLYFFLKVKNVVIGKCVGEWYTDSDGRLVELAKNIIPDTLTSLLWSLL